MVHVSKNWLLLCIMEKHWRKEDNKVMSDGPMVFLILLCERRVEEELNWLIGLSTCGMQFYTADSSMMKKQVAARDLKGT